MATTYKNASCVAVTAHVTQMEPACVTRGGRERTAPYCTVLEDVQVTGAVSLGGHASVMTTLGGRTVSSRFALTIVRNGMTDLTSALVVTAKSRVFRLAVAQSPLVNIYQASRRHHARGGHQDTALLPHMTCKQCATALTSTPEPTAARRCRILSWRLPPLLSLALKRTK